MKKFLALLLVLTMVLSLAACGSKTPEATEAPTEAATVATEAPAPDTYTYNLSLSTFPTLWNIHNYETSTDAEIADYITTGFYTFDYNETLDGYAMVPHMAVDFPVDVTADYIGQYGLEEGAENRAYVITLRDDLKWEDGTPINANDFVESYKRLLNPDAQNYRADGMYSSSLVMHNAEGYLKSGKTVKSPADSIVEVYSEDLDADLIFSLAPPSGSDGEVSMRPAFGFPASYDAVACADYIISNYLADSAFTAEAAAAMEGKTLAEIKADETLKAAWEALIGWWQTEPNEELDFFLMNNQFPEVAWEEVGFQALSDNELLLVIDKPLSGFYLHYALTSSYLVNIELYDSCITYVDGVYTNTYGTSAETTMSYGPYKLTSFQADKQFTLEKNEYYFDLSDDTYQTTHIVYDYVPEASTRLELFLEGKLDSYGLTKEDMETYSLSDHCYYTPGDSIYFMVFNPDMEALTNNQAAAGENINKTILTLTEFRQAMSFAMNRAEFCLATSPTNGAAFALFSELIISDPESGTAYRTTDEAKNTMANFWGVSEEYGEGKLYADIDEAIDSITGYNLTKAQQLFDAAYDKAVAEGLMDEDDVVQILVGTPNNTSSFYNNGYEYIVNNYTEAVKGTKLEGKLTFTRDDTLGNGFSDALKNNQVDMLFGVGWTGSALDPYGLMEVYVSPNYQYDDSWDTSKVEMTLAIDGVDYTASLYDWYTAMSGVAVTLKAADGTELEFSCGSADNDPVTRMQILAGLENAILTNYTTIPLMDASSAGLKGMQIQYYTEDYVFGMGRGGVKYNTYNYTDAEWAAFVEENNAVLDYT